MHQAQTRSGNETGDDNSTLRRQVEELQQQNIDMEQLNQHRELQLRAQIETKTREAREHQAHSTQLQRMLEAKERQLQENQQIIEVKDRQLQETQQITEAKDRQLQEKQQTIEENQCTIATKQYAIEKKERQLQQTQQQLQDSQQLLAQFQQSLQHNNEIISDLRQTISHHEEIQQLKQQDIASSIQPQHQPVTAEEIQTNTAVSLSQKDISKITWREGKQTPQTIFRGATVVHGNTAYFTPFNSVRVYSYQNVLGNEQWSRLPDNPNKEFSLVVIDGLLTSVGGWNSSGPTNTLLGLAGESKREQWSEVFPPMPTPRHSTACITTEPILHVVVAGGYARDKYMDTVEVMDINTNQ